MTKTDGPKLTSSATRLSPAKSSIGYCLTGYSTPLLPNSTVKRTNIPSTIPT